MATNIARLAPEPTTTPALHAIVTSRVAAGRAARKRAPRSGIGEWDEKARGHDALATVLAQSAGRLADVVPLRHYRMSLSPWNFYRGAAGVMAADLGSRPNSGLDVQMCGDAHVLNFGLWATPERNLNFDLRDFDETLPGPFEWDLARLAASLVVAAREDGVKPARIDAAVRAAVDAYRRQMYSYAQSYELDIWYDGMRVDSFVHHFERADRGQVKIFIEKGKKKKTSIGAYPKLTAIASGRPRITPQHPVRVTLPDHEQSEVVDELLAGYRYSLRDDRRALFDRFGVVDVVRQVVGVGSVGMIVYLVLFQGRSGSPLFLQCKQAKASVYEAQLLPAAQDNHGERVISGKRMVKSATDIFEGWGSLGARDFYVRQYRDMKLIASTALIAPRLPQFATACGTTLARAHARSGDSMAIDSYMGTGSVFTEAMVSFAYRYADQNQRDHAQLVSAIASGECPSAGD